MSDTSINVTQVANEFPLDISKAITNNAYMVFDRMPRLSYYLKSIQIPMLTVGDTRIPTPQTHPWHIPSVQSEITEVTLMWYCDENYVTYFAMLDWMTGLQYACNVKQAMSDAVITITNNAKEPIIRIFLQDSWPMSVGQLDFDTYSTDPCTPFLTLKVNGMKWEYLDPNLATPTEGQA